MWSFILCNQTQHLIIAIKKTETKATRKKKRLPSLKQTLPYDFEDSWDLNRPHLKAIHRAFSILLYCLDVPGRKLGSMARING